MRSALLVLVLAVLWTLSGFVVGVTIQGFAGGQWTFLCASLNLIAGLVMLLLITRDEHARRIFYGGPRGDEPGLPAIGFLWVIPLVLLLVALVWWLIAQILK